MKQHISIEQLNDLSEKGKERLRKWWKPKEYDLYMWSEDGLGPFGTHYYHDVVWCCEDDVRDKDAFPLLSIGQMIEFLGDDWNNKAQILLVTEDQVVFPNNYCGNKLLCDLLWEAVKEVLEK